MGWWQIGLNNYYHPINDPTGFHVRMRWFPLRVRMRRFTSRAQSGLAVVRKNKTPPGRKPSQAETRRDWTRRNGYQTPYLAVRTVKKRCKTRSSREATGTKHNRTTQNLKWPWYAGNTQASRPTTDRPYKNIMWYSCGIPHSCTTGNTIENTTWKYHRKIPQEKYHRKIPQNNPVVFLPITTGQYHTEITTQEYHTAKPHINQYHTKLPQQYHTSVPHSNTTHHYHTTVPHSSNTTQHYHTAIPQQYHTAIPHSNTTQQYHTAIPHSNTTQQYHSNTTQQYHSSTTQKYHTAIHSSTTQQYHTAIPHSSTTAIPHSSTTQQYHTAVPQQYHTAVPQQYHTAVPQ